MTDGEFKIIFTGPMGAGKTTAITALSDQECVSTDVVNTLEQVSGHGRTIIISIFPVPAVCVCGTPGGACFMWPIWPQCGGGLLLMVSIRIWIASPTLDAFWEGGPR